MGNDNLKSIIESGKTALGIELGSTRIKAVLVDDKNIPIASGSHDWENRLENGIWTYRLEDIWNGAVSYTHLDVYKRQVRGKEDSVVLSFSSFMYR